MKVKIKNFQSVEDVAFDINGFTVLVGKSNIGKSAIVRAIQGALVNTPAESYITTGKKFIEVDLETQNAHILWRKGGGHNDYIINGTPLDNVGRGSVPELEKLGFGELKISGESISVQVADQWHPLFLLDAKGSVAAEAISDVGRLTEVQEALKNCEKDRREVKSIRKVREKDLNTVCDSLKSFGGYDEDRASVFRAREVVTKVNTCREGMSRLESVIVKKDRLDTLCAHLTGVEAIDILLWEDSQIIPLRQVELFCGRLLRLTPTLTRLKGVGDVGIPSLDYDDSSIKALERFNTRAIQYTLQYKRYKGVDEIEILSTEFDIQGLKKLESFSTRLGSAGKSYQRFKGVNDIDIPSVDLDVSPLSTLLSFQDRLTKITNALPKWKEEVKVLESELEGILGEIHDVLHEAGVCPTCDRSVE